MLWLVSPSRAFAESAEIAFDVALVVATVVVVVGLIGEYRKRGWWMQHHQLAELLVLVGVAAEVFAEAGSFWYSMRLQSIEERAYCRDAEGSRLRVGGGGPSGRDIRRAA